MILLVDLISLMTLLIKIMVLKLVLMVTAEWNVIDTYNSTAKNTT